VRAPYPPPPGLTAQLYLNQPANGADLLLLSKVRYQKSVSGQPSEHQAAHCRVDERFAGCAEPLVVCAEATVLAEPGEGPLHNPASGQHAAEYFWQRRQALRAESDRFDVTDIAVRNPLTTCMRRMPNDLDTPAELLLDLMLAAPGVALVDPNMLDAGELVVRAFQQ
jgi:hypothetical protein